MPLTAAVLVFYVGYVDDHVVFMLEKQQSRPIWAFVRTENTSLQPTEPHQS